MKLKIKQGTTSKLVRVFVQDSTATDGSGLAGIAHNTAGLTAYYICEGSASSTAITLTAGTTGTWASGAWSEVDSTNMPGIYELGLPDAVVDATSEGSVVLMLRGAANMAPVLVEIELDAVAYRDATSFGLSRLDAAVGTRSTFNPASDTVANVTNVASTAVCVSNSDMRGTDGANTVAPDNAGITSNGAALTTTTKTGVTYTATAQSGDTIQVTLS